jgi:hypothetical protein
MNTLDELLYYCKEIEPVGALLLTGDWGCGKTYLIEHELKDALYDSAIVLRISLFGINSPEEIHNVVKNKWIEAYCKAKGFKSITDKVKVTKNLIIKLKFLPETFRNIASTDMSVFVQISKKIEGKSVILVFDDLERCRMSSVDVLGIINDYCENQKFQTIVIANQEKIKTKQESVQMTADIQIVSNKKDNTEWDEKKATLIINKLPLIETGELSYKEIKEKIIQRTVHYMPDYAKIVNAVIRDVNSYGCEYRVFVETCEEGLLELFAPDRNEFVYERNSSGEEIRLHQSGVHNIRSLKCAINDFYRVYSVLYDNEFENIDKWFYSFTSYLISYKADIIKDSNPGTFFSEEKVRELYPTFNDQYIFKAVKQWILYGVWNVEAIHFEIDIIKKREEAQRPCEIIRYSRIMDIEEEIIEEGFEKFLNNAYMGNLTLNDYVLFIENCSWARRYQYSFPVKIDFEKVKEGVNRQIDILREDLPDGQILFKVISVDDRNYFSCEEWEIYVTISSFALGDGLMFFRNRKQYIEKMKELTIYSFDIIHNKRFNMFDDEMAMVTANAFDKCNNFEKNMFADCFKKMWEYKIDSEDIKNKEDLNGFSILIELLTRQTLVYSNNNKTFAIIHTKKFISIVNEIIITFNIE